MSRFWRDSRFWRIVGQAAVVLAVVGLAGLVFTNLTRNLRQLGLPFGFSFLNSQASFGIAEQAIAYTPADPYSRALLVGLLNSLKVMVSGVVLATGVGFTVGIARLSDNWLVRQLALVYVEIFRNTPLLLQLFFWYFAVFLGLPPAEQAIDWLGLVSFSQQGIRVVGGMTFSPEFSALLLGLTCYTAAFIAEIVRAGIQSVPRGQQEAAQALGLRPGQIMRLVIVPQALRVIVPPLTSQYLNLAKNTSLAIAVGYADVYFVASATFNQTGRAVEVMLLLMTMYLAISLLIAIAMNTYNRSIRLVER